MPYSWTTDAERATLLIACTELKPSPAVRQVVADKLGGGLTAGAVSQKFGKLKKEAEKLQQLETPKKGTAVDTKSTGTGTKRKREKNAEANKETPSKPRKKSMTAVNPGDLAAEDDVEFKEQVKMEIDEDEEMEDEGRNAEEA